MQWQVESTAAYVRRVYDTWTPRFAYVPHSCANRACGTVRWWEPMLSRLEGGYCGPYRLWACSAKCANTVKEDTNSAG